MKIKAGECFGEWTLVGDKPLGCGGNSDVWRAVGSTQQEVAVKFLTRFDRYERFKDEVRFQKSLSFHVGVLPLLDNYLPDSPSRADRPWLVTPVAQPVKEYIENGENKLRTAIEVICGVASTLVDIHAQESSHRDIKPENLFMLSERPVIGDFGLVTYLGKSSITTSGERLGPIHYVAPELIGNVDEPTDSRPGDVYALAKTLWVLSTGQRYPVPGNIVSTEKSCRLSAFVNHDRAILLDRLIDAATLIDPDARPTCSDFLKELKSWLSEKSPSTLPMSIPASISARIRQHVDIFDRAKRDRKTAKEETERLLDEMHHRLLAIGQEFRSAIGVDPEPQPLPNGNTNLSLRHFNYKHVDRKNEESCVSYGNRIFSESFPMSDNRTISIRGCLLLETFSATDCLLQGGLVVVIETSPLESCLTKYFTKEEYTFRLGSANQQSIFYDFLTNMQQQIPGAAQYLVKLLDEELAEVIDSESVSTPI